MTVSEYASKFQALSYFVLELVVSEERKCKHFEKGLRTFVKRLVVSHRIGRFFEIVECVRSVEIPIGRRGNVEVWKPREQWLT